MDELSELFSDVTDSGLFKEALSKAGLTADKLLDLDEYKLERVGFGYKTVVSIFPLLTCLKATMRSPASLSVHCEFLPSLDDSSFLEKHKKELQEYHKPLEQTLKEAGVNLTDLLNEFESWLSVARKRGLKDRLSRNESLALFAFTNCFDDNGESLHKIVNRVLKERDKVELSKYCGYVLHVLSVLRKLPQCKDSKALYCYADDLKEEFMKTSGKTFVLPGFTLAFKDVLSVKHSIQDMKKPYVLEVQGDFCCYDVSNYMGLHNIDSK